ncbi:MAG: PepSY domain-containing protein, partial [Longimicrobiales bacterium]
ACLALATALPGGAQAPASKPSGSAAKAAAALAARAKVTETAARATAMARVRSARVQSFELEEENGKLIYSYDLKVTGRSGIEEVQVDAITGKIISVVHESPADEKKERAAEAREKAASAKGPKAPVKKPGGGR